MKGFKNVLGKGVAVAAVVGMAASVAVPAEAAWTVDLTSTTTDITTVGTAVLALSALIFGFRVVRRMVGR